jgi:hypothetical protein
MAYPAGKVRGIERWKLERNIPRGVLSCFHLPYTNHNGFKSFSRQINQNFATVFHTEAAKLLEIIIKFGDRNLKIQHRTSFDLNGLKNTNLFKSFFLIFKKNIVVSNLKSCILQKNLVGLDGKAPDFFSNLSVKGFVLL